MKVKEFFAELVWDKDEEDWILSRGLDDIINEWLENNNVNIIDVNYNSVVIGSKNNCIQSTALLFYKEKNNTNNNDKWWKQTWYGVGRKMG